MIINIEYCIVPYFPTDDYILLPVVVANIQTTKILHYVRQPAVCPVYNVSLSYYFRPSDRYSLRASVVGCNGQTSILYSCN